MRAATYGASIDPTTALVGAKARLPAGSVPVLALVPLPILWRGYGLTSKIAMAVLIICFPVPSAFLDDLRHCDPGLIDMTRSLGANRR